MSSKDVQLLVKQACMYDMSGQKFEIARSAATDLGECPWVGFCARYALAVLL